MNTIYKKGNNYNTYNSKSRKNDSKKLLNINLTNEGGNIRLNVKKEQKYIYMRNEGITLIALVITIIVLLILAGVTIATLTGRMGY